MTMVRTLLVCLALGALGCDKNLPDGATGGDALVSGGDVAFAGEPADEDEYMPGGRGLIDDDGDPSASDGEREDEPGDGSGDEQDRELDEEDEGEDDSW